MQDWCGGAETDVRAPFFAVREGWARMVRANTGSSPRFAYWGEGRRKRMDRLCRDVLG